jgi:hypothetical protein
MAEETEPYSREDVKVRRQNYGHDVLLPVPKGPMRDFLETIERSSVVFTGSCLIYIPCDKVDGAKINDIIKELMPHE